MAAAVVCCPRWRCVEELTLTLTHELYSSPGKRRVIPAAPHAVLGSSRAGALPAPEPYELCHSGSLCTVPSAPPPPACFSSFIFVFVSAGGGGEAVCVCVCGGGWLAGRALWCVQLCCGDDRRGLRGSAGSFQAALFTRRRSMFHLITFLFPPLTLSFPGSSHQYWAVCGGFRRTARRFPHPTFPPFC